MSALRDLLRVGFGRIARIYFREIEVAGEVPDASTAGRLFGANHVNALVDPILVLTQAPCEISPIAKSTLWQIPGLRFLLDAAGAVPIVRRRDDPTKAAGSDDAVFARVASHLATGGNILIFPEGTSHNEPHLLALKTGAGRMLARARRASAALTFQAVALEFDRRDVFRSRCLVLFGPVRDVATVARDVTDDDALAARITDVLAGDLSGLLVEAESWEARMLLVRVAELFADEASGSLAARNALGRRVEEARAALRDDAPDVLSRATTEARAYFEELDTLGLTDADVVRGARTRARDGAAAWALVALPLALVGFALYAIPYQLPRLVTSRLGASGDVASTYKLGVGLAVFPLWATLLVAAALFALPWPASWIGALVAVASPFAALPWLDHLDRVSAKASTLVPPEIRGDRLHALAGKRAALLTLLETARDREGALSRSAPPSPSTRPEAG